MISLRDFVGALTTLYIFGLTTVKASPVGPQLQQQFLVGKLPNVTWTMGGDQYAGNLPVQRGTNLSLFFWGVENSPGSLTAPAGNNNAPWNIWLNGLVARFYSHGALLSVGLICFSPTVDPDHRA